eukprot:sb/3475981/
MIFSRILPSEHHIEQEGEKLKVRVCSPGRSGKLQEYQVGETFSETEINGENSEVQTAWEGETKIKELHRTESIEYELVRELKVPLHYSFPSDHNTVPSYHNTVPLVTVPSYHNTAPTTTGR